MVLQPWRWKPLRYKEPHSVLQAYTGKSWRPMKSLSLPIDCSSMGASVYCVDFSCENLKRSGIYSSKYKEVECNRVLREESNTHVIENISKMSHMSKYNVGKTTVCQKPTWGNWSSSHLLGTRELSPTMGFHCNIFTKRTLCWVQKFLTKNSN